MKAFCCECSVWRGFDTLEAFNFERTSTRVFMGGLVTYRKNVKSAIRYKLTFTENWHLIDVSLDSPDDPSKHIMISKNKAGNWYNEYKHRLSELDGCEFVDLPFSPSTKSIPHLADDLTDRVIKVARFNTDEFRFESNSYIYTVEDSTKLKAYCIETGKTDYLLRENDGHFYNIPNHFKTLYFEKHGR
ncbi:putative glycolipid-binding domain-containing protein [Pedobacter sp. MC2016-24]|uniref:putative glycolipid-binding domain-containing protein n=1 Tax=Pedobacter sp. MC2016-24 TaxID=2780090 RepID=UPI00187FB976|nr:putative glycolipid-binding domain-containing protein [Pedobacter sp. MC2016-24]MBE9601488.1 putative glycolipid-binding domain-containing protein [Pedobacter sp. MC2016-24]